MHELSVTQEIVNILVEEARKHGVNRVTMVKLKLGTFSTFQPEAVNFYFEILKKDFPELETTELQIELEPGRCMCRECNLEFESSGDMFPVCPRCGSIFVEILSGKDFLIEYMEVEDEDKSTQKCA